MEITVRTLLSWKTGMQISKVALLFRYRKDSAEVQVMHLKDWKLVILVTLQSDGVVAVASGSQLKAVIPFSDGKPVYRLSASGDIRPNKELTPLWGGKARLIVSFLSRDREVDYKCHQLGCWLSRIAEKKLRAIERVLVKVCITLQL